MRVSVFTSLCVAVASGGIFILFNYFQKSMVIRWYNRSWRQFVHIFDAYRWNEWHRRWTIKLIEIIFSLFIDVSAACRLIWRSKSLESCVYLDDKIKTLEAPVSIENWNFSSAAARMCQHIIRKLLLMYPARLCKFLDFSSVFSSKYSPSLDTTTPPQMRQLSCVNRKPSAPLDTE